MARLRTALDIRATPEEVWNLITDWRSHGRWIPLTVVTIDSDSPATEGMGTRFTGRTGIGPVGFDDPMTVTEWQPPAADGIGHCRIVKRGRWVGGWAEIDVHPTGTGAELVWLEEVKPRWTPKFADPVVSAVGTFFFGRTLRAMAAELT